MVTAALLFALSVQNVAPADRIAVFVAAPSRGGFVDTNKDIQDSIKDIRDRLSSMKELQVVTSRDKADIVLTVVTRGVGSEAYGHRLQYTEYYNNAALESVPIIANTYWVAAVFEVGDYRKELMGAYTNETRFSMGAWTECAKQVASDLKSWIVANADQLKDRFTLEHPLGDHGKPAPTSPKPPPQFKPNSANAVRPERASVAPTTRSPGRTLRLFVQGDGQHLTDAIQSLQAELNSAGIGGTVVPAGQAYDYMIVFGEGPRSAAAAIDANGNVAAVVVRGAFTEKGAADGVARDLAKKLSARAH